MEAVDHLRHAGHADLLGMALESVECQPRDQCVAQRGLLGINVGRSGLGAGVVPGAPLVDGELHMAAGIVDGERAPMALNESLHAIGPRQQFVPLIVSKVDRRLAGGAAVIVQRPAPDPLHEPWILGRERGEKALGPGDIVAVRTGGDEGQRDAHAGRPGGVAAERGRVLLGRHVAAATPALVAHAPQADVERIAVAALFSQARQRGRAGRCVAVVDPLVEILGRQAPDVAGNVRRGAGEPAEPHELRSAERVGLEALRAAGLFGERFRVHPEAGTHRPCGARTDAVTPVVGIGEAAARPADHRRAQRFQGIDQGLPDSSDIGDAAVLADPHAVVDYAAQVLDEVAVQQG